MVQVTDQGEGTGDSQLKDRPLLRTLELYLEGASSKDTWRNFIPDTENSTYKAR